MTANRFRFRMRDELRKCYVNLEEIVSSVIEWGKKNECVILMPHMDCVFEQSTGLLDSQGREIFEGHKVRYYSGEYPIGRHPLHGHFTIGEEQLLTFGDARVCTIIGNIHEGET